MTNRLILLLVGALRASEQASIPPIRYSLGEDAQVSLRITSGDGTVARELLHAAPRGKGPCSENWDGLDDQGKPAGRLKANRKSLFRREKEYRTWHQRSWH